MIAFASFSPLVGNAEVLVDGDIGRRSLYALPRLCLIKAARLRNWRRCALGERSKGLTLGTVVPRRIACEASPTQQISSTISISVAPRGALALGQAPEWPSAHVQWAIVQHWRAHNPLNRRRPSARRPFGRERPSPSPPTDSCGVGRISDVWVLSLSREVVQVEVALRKTDWTVLLKTMPFYWLFFVWTPFGHNWRT
jgi:hypothetical protein